MTALPPTHLELLRRMVLIRRTEETIAERYREWRMRCPTHLCTGQEAVPAAVGLALAPDDRVVSTHRSHGHYLGKGGNLPAMIAELYGKRTGCSAGRGGSMHLIDPAVGFVGSTAIVGGTIPVGVGLALASRIHGSGHVSCVYLGDAATEEGVFAESVGFAVLRNLPVLFICENNLYSVYSPLHVRQPRDRKITDMVRGLGCGAESGDGNDAPAVLQQVTAGLHRLRRGEGPQFFEFFTYRWREHCGPNYDNDIGYRTEQEFLTWKERDPVRLLEERLLHDGTLTPAARDRLHQDIQRDVDTAFAFAESSPFPNPEEALSGVFQE